MSNFGLDIGSTSIKVAEVRREGEKFRLVSAGLTPTSQPGMESEAEKDLVFLATAIKKLHQDAKITNKNVVIALPENKIFSRVITLPQMSDDELAQALQWEAEQFIPMPIKDVSLDSMVVSQGKKGQVEQQMEVLVVAAPNNLIKKYQQIIAMAGFRLVAIETELVAAARALLAAGSPASIIVDFGAMTTDIAIVRNGLLCFSRSIPSAGQAFTRAISTTLSLETGQAEQYKTAYGLTEKKLEGKVKEAITPVVNLVVNEIKKAIQFWQEKEKEAIKTIILSGGSANLPEVTSFLTKAIGVEVQVADPFVLLLKDEKQIANFRQSTPFFPVAVGLAMKEV